MEMKMKMKINIRMEKNKPDSGQRVPKCPSRDKERHIRKESESNINPRVK